jgi:hypothetical protein
MSAPIIPWQPSVFPVEVANELNRRKINRSFRFINAQKADWNNAEGDWNKYRGPMVSWIRACSNGAGHPLTQPPRQRFVLYSGKGFYQTYGFAPPQNGSGPNEQVIGYTPIGEPHTIENSLQAPNVNQQEGSSNWPINVPAPEISRLEVTVQKELFRRATIEWVCFSWKQLVYMTPYWLVPGMTCMVEWGWNHYNIESLVNLADTNKMRSLWDNAYPLYFDNIIKSNGNYDVIYGIISNFNWSIEGNKIICTTEITSKDRLYTGIAKDYGLSSQNPDNSDDPNDTKNGIFKSLRDFINDKDTIKNLKTLVMDEPITDPSTYLNNIKQDPINSVWFDILKPLLTSTNLTGDAKQKAQQAAMRLPWVFGVFAGRIPDEDNGNGSYTQRENFGTPKANDFDKKIQDNDPSKFWINMGLIVQLLNYFSDVPSGANQGNKAFEVDIQNSVITGHPNLISCDPRVLIPNWQAPKFLWGEVGIVDNANNTDGSVVWNPNVFNPKTPYTYQVLRPIQLGTKPSTVNLQLRNICYQTMQSYYRDDLDSIINYNVYRYVNAVPSSYIQVQFPIKNYSFPARFESTSDSTGILPESPRGLAGNKLEQDYSGLLSNIYISFDLLQDAVNDDSTASYPDIYNYILNVLMNATDGLWNLQLIEVDGVMTITDKNFIGKYGLNNPTNNDNTVYSFDYYDADSLIRSLKFRPVLSDAQATRVIYGAVNHTGSKYQYVDKNDLLNYQFQDALISPASDNSNSDLDQRQTAKDQQRDLIRSVQNINGPSDDGSLQMSLNSFRQGKTTPKGTPTEVPEIIKLVLPNQQVLRLLLADEDYNNNPRYCAVQPGIFLELTLQGIGGLRTFQYFLVRNLPEPYSDRNVIFRITDIHQTLESGTWETVIRAQLTPLRGYITQRLTGPLGASNGNNGWPATTVN